MYSTDFFQMHVKGSKSIAHGSSVFLPWHRLYLLDLERQLQKHNPEVSLHYWKFDEPAPISLRQIFLGKVL
jgi:tyrosinase